MCPTVILLSIVVIMVIGPLHALNFFVNQSQAAQPVSDPAECTQQPQILGLAVALKQIGC